MNRLKTTLLLGLLTGLIVAAGYYFGGQNGALYALGAAALMNFFSYWFSDKLVLSMYHAKPADEVQYKDLHTMLADLARRANIPTPRLYIVDMEIPNAFATGRNAKNAVVAVTTGILKILNEKELRGVLAHEISHVTNQDILVSSIAATLAGALSYIAQFAYYSSGRRDREGGALGGLFFLIVMPILATLIQLAISRSREYLADASGAEISGERHALASALRKLHMSSQAHPLAAEPKYEATAHLFFINPFRSSFFARMFSTHPPVEERIARLESGEVLE